MQIDFHHVVTYVCARLAGFPPAEAGIVAGAAQYVDDAVDSGCIRFGNGALYRRISSAHKLIDMRNLDEIENRHVWVPFHFLPGNGGMGPGTDPEGTFITKLVCTHDSPIARDMVAAALLDRNKSYGLHRLGIALHVYADTWAHEGFAGVVHDINRIDNAKEKGWRRVLGEMQDFLRDILDDAVLPLGHACAQVLPDLPFLAWEYENGKGERISRDNCETFCDAADRMCRLMRAYRNGHDETTAAPGLRGEDLAALRQVFSALRDSDGAARHESWLGEIAAGRFSFGPERICYIETGPGSWEHEALGEPDENGVYEYRESFLASNWKLFHDALHLHNHTVLHDILPRYGICAG